ncbi:MAG: extracellular solute-binding protein [Clostridia bacterium]|nr:extracellular solute-binding protein [Clostridia bacterium]
MKKTASYLYLGLIFLFLYAPILLMIALSFNDARHGISVWQGFTLENYASLLKNEELMDALINSLVIALLSAVGACLLGTLGALGLNNVKKGRGVLMNFSNLPIINPEIVTGVSLMLLFIAVFGMKLGFFTVLLSHVVFNTPYVILNVMPRLRRMDKNLFEAALDLGCPPAKAFFKVVLPEIFPGVFAGFLISLTYSFDDFIISYFTGGNFQTLSVFVNNSMKKGIQPWMASMTGVIFVAVLMILLIMNIHDARAEAIEKNKISAPTPKKGMGYVKAAAAVLCIALILGICLPRVLRSDDNTIVVCNWGEYMSTGDCDFDVIAEFEKATGINVEYVTAESNEALYAKMKSGSGKYDVIFPSEYMAERMIDEGMLAKLDYDNIPNYESIMDAFKGMEHDPKEEYTVPYFWGTVGILYNADMLTEKDLAMMENPKDWSILWSKNYPNQIMMFDNPRDAFGIALKQLGYSQNTTDETEIREAAALLKEQKFYYGMDQFFEMIPSGSLAIAPYYAGDCMYVMEDNPDMDLRFVIPECGTNIFSDAMCVPATSRKQAQAEAFINFMLTAEAGKANTEYVYYSTPNQAVFDVLEPEMQENKVAYPQGTEDLKAFRERMTSWEAFQYLPVKINDLMTDLWNEIKTNNK